MQGILNEIFPFIITHIVAKFYVSTILVDGEAHLTLCMPIFSRSKLIWPYLEIYFQAFNGLNNHSLRLNQAYDDLWKGQRCKDSGYSIMVVRCKIIYNCILGDFYIKRWNRIIFMMNKLLFVKSCYEDVVTTNPCRGT